MDAVYAVLPLQPKGQIRLITIEPGNQNDPIVVSMRKIDLDDTNLSFEGLSYTWGSIANPVTIICNNAPFAATQNLHSALVRLRLNQRKTFWIDAICINQADPVERANQVKQMRRIYSLAKPVWVDLGDPNPEGMPQVFELMQKLVNVLPDDENDSTPIDPYKFPEIGLPAYWDEVWVWWQQILALPYFRRLWVIQEFAVAKDMYFMIGVKFFPWHNLYYITHRLKQHGISEDTRPMRPGIPAQTRIAAILGHNNVRFHYQSHWTYEKAIPLKVMILLDKARDVEATEPKDKVYGILGIAGDIDLDDPDFEIKYDEHETEADLFTRVARGLVRAKKEHALDLMQDGGVAFTDRQEGLSSWIPDWTTRRAGTTLGGLQNIGYRAASDLFLHAVVVEGSGLQVRGRIVDRIAQITPAYRPETEGEHSDVYYGVAVARWLRSAFDLALHYFPNALSPSAEKNAAVKEHVWRTLICNKTHVDETAPDAYAHAFDALLKRQQFVDAALIDARSDEDIQISDPTGEYASANRLSAPYRLALQNSMYTKAFCITEEKMMAMVPGAAKTGDCIVAVAGSNVPFVMRALNEKETAWELVQECYVHGIMSGEYAEDTYFEEMLIV